MIDFHNGRNGAKHSSQAEGRGFESRLSLLFENQIVRRFYDLLYF